MLNRRRQTAHADFNSHCIMCFTSTCIGGIIGRLFSSVDSDQCVTRNDADLITMPCIVTSTNPMNLIGLQGGAENAGRENDGREIDGPICRE